MRLWIWTFLWNYSILVISKKSVQYQCRVELKPVAIKLKITQCDRWPIFTPRRSKTFYLKFEHFFEIISILVISNKSVQYHCRWNLNQLRSSWKLLIAIDDPYLLRVVQIHLKFEHFFEIISILVISKKSVQYQCRVELKPVAIKLKITQCDRWPIFTPRRSKTFKIWTFLWNHLYISHLKVICPISL